MSTMPPNDLVNDGPRVWAGRKRDGGGKSLNNGRDRVLLEIRREHLASHGCSASRGVLVLGCGGT